MATVVVQSSNIFSNNVFYVSFKKNFLLRESKEASFYKHSQENIEKSMVQSQYSTFFCLPVDTYVSLGNACLSR